MLVGVLVAGSVALTSPTLAHRPFTTGATPRAAPLVVRVGGRVVTFAGAGSDGLRTRIAADLGAAVHDVEAFWGVDWPHRITVITTDSDQQFRAQAGGGSRTQWADIAAVAVADRVDPEQRSASGQRIVFAPGAVGMSDAALRIVLTHELFHYAARADTAADAPRWLTEGVADFVARPATAVPDAVPLPEALPSDPDLDVPGPQRVLGYDRAWWFARFIADRYGAGTLRALYVAACGPGHSDLPAAVEHVLGTDTAGLIAGWRQWLS